MTKNQKIFVAAALVLSRAAPAAMAQTDNYPKAFRIGGCKTVSADKAEFEMVLLWRDADRSEERKINVETVRENGNWVVNKIGK